MNDNITIKDLIELSFSKGISKKDASHLVSHVLGIPYAFCKSNIDFPVGAAHTIRYNELLAQLLSGVPFEYVTNHSEFFGLDLYVDSNVLIPRPETEQLVELVVAYATANNSKTMLDMCSGSGAILLATLSGTNMIGVGADISQPAVDIANKNATTNKIYGTRFIQSNLFEHIVDRFDIIASNPPYIPTHEMKELDSSVAEHEPHLALHGGDSGLVFYEKIIASAPKYLNEKGAIFFEIGYNQGKAVMDLLSKDFEQIKLTHDYAGHERIVSATLK